MEIFSISLFDWMSADFLRLDYSFIVGFRS